VLRLTNAFVIAMAALGTAGTHHSQQYLFGLAAQELRKCGVKKIRTFYSGADEERGATRTKWKQIAFLRGYSHLPHQRSAFSN
jgi:hypothetical protein